MSVLDDVLFEEYERLKRFRKTYIDKMEELPKGYLSHKKIGKKRYAYLQWREGDKIISRYIPDNEINMLERRVEERRKYQQRLQVIESDMKKIERVVGVFDDTM